MPDRDWFTREAVTGTGTSGSWTSYLTEVGRREMAEGKVMCAEWFSGFPPLCPECGAGWTGSPCPKCGYVAPVPVDFEGRPFVPSPAPSGEPSLERLRVILADAGEEDWATQRAYALAEVHAMLAEPSPAPRDEARETLIRALLSDVTQSHADPKSADYNECDKAPCAWCEDAFRVMAAAPRADAPNENEVWQGAMEQAALICEDRARLHRHGESLRSAQGALKTAAHEIRRLAAARAPGRAE